MDKGMSGLDDETQKRLENSVFYYVKMNGAAVLWSVPSKAYEGAQTLSIHPIWMWDAVGSCL